jgi:hypothetical protein
MPLAIGLLALGASVTSSSYALDPKRACVEAHAQAQLLRKKGELRAAREQLRGCVRSECPQLVRNECQPWLDQVEARIPTIVLGVKMGDRDLSTVRVLVDNVELTQTLDGKPIEVETGPHTFRFEAEGADPIEREVIVREGEKDRVVRVVMNPDKTEVMPPEIKPSLQIASRPVPFGIYVLGAAALAGGSLFAVFATSGKSQEDQLASSCAPACARSEVGSVRSTYNLADASLGVGVIAGVSAAVWFFLRPTKLSNTASRVDFTPTTQGAAVTWSTPLR